MSQIGEMLAEADSAEEFVQAVDSEETRPEILAEVDEERKKLCEEKGVEIEKLNSTETGFLILLYRFSRLVPTESTPTSQESRHRQR